MKPFWIETGNRLRLAILFRPRGGRWLDVDILLMKEAGVDVLVSMLPANEAAELGIADEVSACQRAGVSYSSLSDSFPQVGSVHHPRCLGPSVKACGRHAG
jgi:hypothetical protein